MNLKIGRWGFTLDYNYGPPYPGCDCSEYDYCRCSVYENIEIKAINIDMIIDDLYANHFSEESNQDIIKYCICRLISIHKLYNFKDENNYEVNVTSGYYGEELDDVSIENEKFKIAFEKLKRIFTNQERIEFILKEEYGYILNHLENKNYKIIEVDINDIEPHNTAKHDSSICAWVQDIPIGIYLKIGNRYRCIDGHHRLNKTIKEKLEKVNIIVATNEIDSIS